MLFSCSFTPLARPRGLLLKRGTSLHQPDRERRDDNGCFLKPIKTFWPNFRAN